MSRADVIRNAYQRYAAGQITLPELMRTIVQWRPKH